MLVTRGLEGGEMTDTKEKGSRGKTPNLTERKIRLEKAPETGQSFLWDGMVTGLGFRITAGGNRAYVFKRRFKGEQFRFRIGAYSSYSLEEARCLAREYQSFIDQGIDPRVVKARREAATELETTTLADLWWDYLNSNMGRWSARHLDDHEYLAKEPKGQHPGGVLWPLLSRHIDTIDVHALEDWAREAKQAPARSKASRGKNTVVRQGYVRLRACWRWGYQQDKYKPVMSDPKMFRQKSFTDEIPPARAKKDTLEKSQLKAWFKHVRQIQNPIISTYLQCLLLTGCRRNELTGLKWTDIDFQWKKLRLHDKVEEDGRVIPLTPFVEYLIGTLPKENEYVFSSAKSKSGRLQEPRISHKKALKEAGIPQATLSLHGLRRSFSNLSEWCELPSGICAQIQGHKPSAIQEKHYKDRPIELLAMWHTKFETWVLEQAKIEFDAKAAQEGLHAV
jgi:integrase